MEKPPNEKPHDKFLQELRGVSDSTICGMILEGLREAMERKILDIKDISPVLPKLLFRAIESGTEEKIKREQKERVKLNIQETVNPKLPTGRFETPAQN